MFARRTTERVRRNISIAQYSIFNYDTVEFERATFLCHSANRFRKPLQEKKKPGEATWSGNNLPTLGPFMIMFPST